MASLNSSYTDVIVIGAGLSGLSAAHTIQLHNAADPGRDPISYVVLEAIDRVGGKTLTVPAFEDAAGDYIEVDTAVVDEGAAFINNQTHTSMWDLVQRFGLDAVVEYSEGLGISESPAGITTAPSGGFGITDPEQLEQLVAFITWIDTLAATVDIQHPSTTPNAADLDSITVAELVKRYPRFDPSFAGLIEALTRSVVGADPSEISALYWLDYTKSNGGTVALTSTDSDGAQYLRIRQGCQTFSIRLAAELAPNTVQLSTPVTKIARDPRSGIYSVTTSGARGKRVFRSAHIVFSLSSVLYETVQFDPPLPKAKQQLARSTFQGYVSKTVLVYRDPWWRTANLTGELVSTIGPVAAALDSSVEADNQFSLTCFIAGEPGRQWGALESLEERRDAVLAQIGDAFEKATGGAMPEPENVLITEWPKKRFFHGAPTAIAGPGVLTDDAGKTWGMKWGNISFVGTETAVEWKGYMEGAVRSGVRGAEEVLHALKRG